MTEHGNGRCQDPPLPPPAGEGRDGGGPESMKSVRGSGSSETDNRHSHQRSAIEWVVSVRPHPNPPP